MKSVANRLRVVAVLSMAVVLGLPLGAQPPQSGQKQPAPTFKVRVEYVEVDATVHDKDGRFVGDLTKADFAVLEDGKRQEIANLALVDVPMEPRPTTTLLTGQPVERDVYSNDDLGPGRLYLIVIDDLHVHPARTGAARRIAHMFIEQNVAPNDLAAVVVTSGNRRMAQDFTNNRRLLLAAVDKVVGRKIISPGLASLSVMGAPEEGSADTADPQRLFNARTTLDTLASLASFAGTIRNHRKTIVLVGEGPDYDLGASEINPAFAPVPGPPATDSTGTRLPDQPTAPKGTTLARRELRDRMRNFIDAANRGNVTLYAFDPAVYTQGGDDLVDVASGLPGDYDAASGFEIVKGAKLQDDLMAAQDNLRTLANDTGGFAITAGRSFDKAFARIRDENSHYYILGYYPSNDKRDGKFRKIEVRVGRPGVTINARRGYVAPGNEKPEAVVETKEGTSPALREALRSALPTSGLPISVTAAPFRGSSPGNASVLVMLQTPPGAVKFVEKDGRIEGNVELSFVAIDDQGKTAGGEHLDLAMPLKPGTYAAVQQVGLLVESRVTLPPGRYVLRVGARDGMSERVGAVHCDLEVPDFAKLPLSMSGLVISSEQTALANPRPDKALTTLLPGSPAAIRDFGQNDHLGVLVEIYDTKAATPHDIDIITTVVGEDGQEAYRHEDRRSTTEVQGTQGAFGYLLTVPLASLAPGSYVLRVEARSHLQVNAPIARETMIRVIGKP